MCDALGLLHPEWKKQILSHSMIAVTFNQNDMEVTDAEIAAFNNAMNMLANMFQTLTPCSDIPVKIVRLLESTKKYIVPIC
jgi:hypothetical protein